MLLSILVVPALAIGPADADALASLGSSLAPDFTAPTEEDYRQSWLLGTREDPGIELVHGTLIRSKRKQHGGWFAVRDAGGDATLELLVLDDPDADPYEVMGWTYQERPVTRSNTEWTVTLNDDEVRFLVDRRDALAVQDVHWEDWVYTTTLMGFEGSPYVAPGKDYDPPTPAEEQVVKAAMDAMGTAKARDTLVTALDAGLSPWSYLGEELVTAARALGDEELVLRAYRQWRPMGRCSMDDRPAQIAQDYADACFDAGRTGCALQLQVRIMGDQHDRVAQSSFGEEVHETHVDRLDHTGIDVPRFLRGLVLDYDTTIPRSTWIPKQRLGRSVHESSHRDLLEAELERWATDVSLDPYNRMMATITLAYARSYEDHGPLLDGVDGLHPAAAAWVDTVNARRAR